MAISKVLFASLIIFILISPLAVADEMMNSKGTWRSVPPKLDCGVACGARCRLSSRPRVCNRACGTCCARCHCVPPGTSGHKDVCPCYANMTTHGGRPKCP